MVQLLITEFFSPTVYCFFKKSKNKKSKEEETPKAVGAQLFIELLISARALCT
jgi:hypothetical protein